MKNMNGIAFLSPKRENKLEEKNEVKFDKEQLAAYLQESWCLLKVYVTGDKQVGKSACIRRMIDNQVKLFDSLGLASQYQVSEKKELNISLSDDKSVYKVKTFISEGNNQDFLNPHRDFSNYRGMPLIFVLYDVTNEKSLATAENYLKKLIKDDQQIGILVGTKADLIEKRVLDMSQGIELAEQFGFLFFECSAKSGLVIDSAKEPRSFDYILEQAMKKYLLNKFKIIAKADEADVVRLSAPGGPSL